MTPDEATARFHALRAWRATEARRRQVPPYVVATDAVLLLIAAANPATLEALGQVRNVSASKAATYGAAILAALGTGPDARADPHRAIGAAWSAFVVASQDAAKAATGATTAAEWGSVATLALAAQRAARAYDEAVVAMGVA